MYKDTDRQSPLFDVASSMSESAGRRLRLSWAHSFSSDVFTVLLRLESKFAHLYGSTGQPNRSVARLLGVCILQEMMKLTDQQAVDALTFDARWRYALGFEADEDSYLSRQALVEFRSRIARSDPEGELLTQVFDALTDEAIASLGISTAQQRIDSSLIQSNIRSRGRIDLLLTTLRGAISTVIKIAPDALQSLSKGLRSWFEQKEEGRGWFGDTGSRADLKQIGQWLLEIVMTFGKHPEYRVLEEIQLARRVLEEHFDWDPEPGSGKNTPRPRKHAVKVSHPTTLQSPYDPDAGKGHKGTGYMLHVVETCNNPDVELFTGFKLNPANQADQNQSQPVLKALASKERRPNKLYADGGFMTPSALVYADELGTQLVGPVYGPPGLDLLDFGWSESGQIQACPMGHAPLDHRMKNHENSDGRFLHAFFDPSICAACDRACPVRQKKKQAFLALVPRLLRRDEERRKQRQDEWWEAYAIRSGIEGSFSELKRAHGAGRLRVRRRPRVMMALVFKLMGCNVKRWTRARAA